MKRTYTLFARILAVFLMVMMVTCSAPLSGLVGLELPDWLNPTLKAQAATVEKLEYEVQNGQVVITGISSFGEDINIPSKIEGLPVTKIAARAKLGDHPLGVIVNITIPISINKIESRAFAGLFKIFYMGTEKQWQKISKAADYYDPDYRGLYSDSGVCKGIYFLNRANDPQSILDSVGFNLTEVLSNISLDGGKIKGPEIEVLGKKVTLFEFDASVYLPILSCASVTVDNSTKTIKVLIGVEDDYSASVSGVKQTTSYWSESYRQVKSMYQSVTGNKVDTTKLWNKFSSLRGQLKKINANMGFNCDAYLAGYIEFTYATGTAKFKEGGIIAELGFGTTLTSRWPAFPAAYVEFGLSASLGGKLTLTYNNHIICNTNITGSITGSFAVGLGEKNVAKTYIEGKMDATLATSLSLPASSVADSLRITMSGNLYLNAYGLGFKLYSGSWPYVNTQLYPSGSTYSLRRTVTYSEAANEAVPLERDYVTDNSTLEISQDIFRKSDIYEYNAPSIVKLDGTKQLLVWVDDDGTKSDINRTSIYYSIYNGSVWTKPVPVSDDKGFTNAPIVTVNDGRAYVVWQKSEEMSDKDSYTDLSANMELYYSVFDGKKFSEAVKLTDNSLQEIGYSIDAANEKLIVSWTENSENDQFMSTGTNTVKYVEITDTVVSEEIIALTSEYAIDQTVVGENGDMYSLVITDDDYQIHKFANGVSSVIKTSENRINALDVFENQLYFIENENLIVYNEETFAFDATGFDNISNYEFVSNGIDKALLTLKSNEDNSTTLYVSEYDAENDAWALFTPIIEEETYIRSYSPIMRNDGKIQIAVNALDVNENPETDGLFGKATMYVLNGNSYFDLVMGSYLGCDEAELKDNKKINLTFDVTNNSATELSSLDFTLVDELTGEQYVQTVSKTFAPGETVNQTLVYDAPENFTKRDISLTVSSGEYFESNENNNKLYSTIGYADIQLDNIEYDIVNGKAIIRADVANIGLDGAENVTAYLKNTDNSGDIIWSQELGNIGIDETQKIEITVPDEYLTDKGENVYNALYLTVISDAEEIAYANNSEDVVYKYFSDLSQSLTVEAKLKTIRGTTKIKTYKGEDYIAVSMVEGKTATGFYKEMADGGTVSLYEVQGIVQDLGDRYVAYQSQNATNPTAIMTVIFADGTVESYDVVFELYEMEREIDLDISKNIRPIRGKASKAEDAKGEYILIEMLEGQSSVGVYKATTDGSATATLDGAEGMFTEQEKLYIFYGSQNTFNPEGRLTVTTADGTQATYRVVFKMYEMDPYVNVAKGLRPVRGAVTFDADSTIRIKMTSGQKSVGLYKTMANGATFEIKDANGKVTNNPSSIMFYMTNNTANVTATMIFTLPDGTTKEQKIIFDMGLASDPDPLTYLTAVRGTVSYQNDGEEYIEVKANAGSTGVGLNKECLVKYTITDVDGVMTENDTRYYIYKSQNPDGVTANINFLQSDGSYKTYKVKFVF